MTSLSKSTSTRQKSNSIEARWVYEEDNKWIDYDEETTKQLEHNLEIGLQQKDEFMMLVVKLKHGPRFGTQENKEKYVVYVQLDRSLNPPVIYRSVQICKTNKNEMINVTRFPCLDWHREQNQIHEIIDYKPKYRWFWKTEGNEDEGKKEAEQEEDEDNSDDEEQDNEWREYDQITSKQIELTLNKKQKFTILNKSNYFKAPKNKNLYRVEFNHHSIPAEATQIEYISLKKKKKTEILYQEIDEKNEEQQIKSKDEVMNTIMLTKHYMRPISMKFWTQKRVLSNDELQCSICLQEFTENNFLEYWIGRKLRNKAKEEQNEISSKDIAVQLCKCKGEHFFHCGCIAEWFLHKQTCPLCREKYGVIVGYQPKGTMKVIIHKDIDVAGIENKGKGSIEIIHRFPTGIQGAYHQHPGERYNSDQRYIYLPNTREGRQILELIKIGWKRKVLYSVGYSVTRSMNNSIIWNGIHFKTSRYGGISNYGYPDKTYFARVKDEFKEKGITLDDIPKKKGGKK